MVWAAGVAVFSGATLHAQPTIDHSGLDCMRPGEYAVVLTGIDPEDVQTAKVYFRSSLYRDFYYVEMTYQNGEYVGILPQPSAETPAVIYYLEALDSTFNTARTLEYDADVRGRCRQEPAAAYLPGGDPSITVGATSYGAPSIPPGFAAVGIAGTITAAGVASGVGGGIGAGTAVAVGAAVAAGASAGVLAASGGDTTTSSVFAGLPMSSTMTTTTVASGSTTSTPGSGPTSTTTPGPSTTTVPGGSTTTVPGGSTTTTVGVGTTTSAPPTTTTAPPATTTAPTLDASCFTVDVLGACRVRVDATCVALPVDRYEWILDLNGRWNTVEFPDGPASLDYTWPAQDCGNDDTLRFRLKVRRGAGTSTAHKNVFVPGNNGQKTTPSGPVRFNLDTAIDAPGLMRGSILVNGAQLRMVDNRAPVTMNVSGRRSTNTVSAVVVAAAGEPGMWRFALERIVPGSLDVIAGNVVTREPSAVVFRLAGNVGERIELTFVVRE